MIRFALPVAVCLSASVVTALADHYPKTADEAVARISDDERARAAALRERILESTAKLDEAAMKDYVSKIPKTGVPYVMVAIRGGEFLRELLRIIGIFKNAYLFRGEPCRERRAALV